MSVYLQAANILAAPNAWTQYTQARNALGEPVEPISTDAVSYSMAGALLATGDTQAQRAITWLSKRIRCVSAQKQNDSPHFCQMQAVAWLLRIHHDCYKPESFDLSRNLISMKAKI